MYKLLTILALSFSSTLIAQPDYTWGHGIGDAGNDYSRAVATDVSGNVYVTGSFIGTVDFDPGAGSALLTSTTAGYRDAYIAKYAPDGQLLWAKINAACDFNSDGNYIEVDNNGNVIILGHFQGTADFDPGTGTTSVATTGCSDWYVQKLTTDGNLVWVQGTGSTACDEATGLAVSNNGDVVVSGYYAGTTDFDPGAGTFNMTPSVSGYEEGFIYKLDGNGVFQWAKTVQGKTLCYGAAINYAGDVFVTGHFLETADFDPGAAVYNLTSSASWDMFALKLDASGNFIWANKTSGNAWVLAKTLTLDMTGNVLITGRFQSTVDFDPGAGTNSITSNGDTDAFIQKLTTDGTFVWAKTIGGSTTDQASDIRVDSTNIIYTVGAFQGTVDFDPSGGTYNITETVGGAGYIQAMDENGIFQWALAYQSSSGAALNCVSYNENGSVFVCGYFSGTLDVDPGMNTDNLTSNLSDGFVSKLEYCAYSITPDVASLSDITDECEVASLTAPTASNCEGSFIGVHDATLPITAPGSTLVTWTYTNNQGITTTQTQNVIITPIDNGVTQVDAATLTADAAGYNYQWVDCDNANAPINGETGQTFVASAAGNYAVEIDNGTCTVVSACTQLTVGINELIAGFELKVSPNPTHDMIKLQYSEGFEASAVLMDAQSRVINSFELGGVEHVLNMETLPEGMYFIAISVDQERHVIKVQKL